MKRDTVINVFLIIAGILLAIALFGAGVLWRSKTVLKRTAVAQTVSVTKAGEDKRRSLFASAFTQRGAG